MRARELAHPYPILRTDEPAIEAARRLAQPDVDVLLVQDAEGTVVGALHDIGLLDFLLPRYLIDDKALARVVGEGDTAALLARLDGKTVGDVMAKRGAPIPTVGCEQTAVEVAVHMVDSGAALVAVVEGTTILGGLTSSDVITELLGDR